MKPRLSTLWEGVLVACIAFLIPLVTMGLDLNMVVVMFITVVLGMWLLYRVIIYRVLHVQKEIAGKQIQLIRDTHRHQEAFVTLNAALKPEFPLPIMKEWTITPEFANLLVNAIGIHRPKVIVECGSGVSTLIMCYSLSRYEGGTVHALEHMREYVESTQTMLSLHGFTAIGTVHHAELMKFQLDDEIWSWYNTAVLDKITDIDMLIVDGPPGNLSKLARYPALPLLIKKLKDDAIIFLDDYDRQDERAIVQAWKDKFGFTDVVEHNIEHGVCEMRRLRKK